MRDTARRIAAMYLRYLYLHRRSVPRTLEIVFWPVMELMVWGYVAVYVGRISDGRAAVLPALVNAMVMWDVLYRTQQSISISFMEDIWTQNITNVLVSPLRIPEWISAAFLYGITKTLAITALLSLIAFGLYRFDFWGTTGLYLVPLLANLFLFGLALGIFTSGLVVRFGYAAEALNWGIPFLVQPISAVFYPVDVLPGWLQAVSRCVPGTYVFEGMRECVATGRLPVGHITTAFGLNLIYLAAGATAFWFLYRSAHRLGRLGKLGMD